MSQSFDKELTLGLTDLNGYKNKTECLVNVTDLDVVANDVLPAGDARRDGGGRQELDGVAQRRLGAHLAQHFQRVLVNLHMGAARIYE